MPEQYETLVPDWTYARIVLDPGTMQVHVAFVDDTRAVVAEDELRP